MRTKKHIPAHVGFPTVFDHFFGDGFGLTEMNKDWSKPAVNIKEDDNGYYLDVMTPGFNKEDFKIELKEGKLEISADVKKEEKEEKENFTHVEFRQRSFKRVFVLPKGKADEDQVSASYDQGILHVSIAKKEEAKPKAPRKIEVA